MLEDFALDSAVAKRVTLVRSSSVGKEFKKLPFRSTEMSTIFRAVPPKASDGVVTAGCRKRFRNADDDTESVIQSKRGCLVTSVPERVNPGRTQSSADRTIWVNAAGQRVDSRLPELFQADQGVWPKIAKATKLHFCHAHHMNGDCPGGCGFSHHVLSDQERLAFRRSLREQVCHVGLSCRDVNCYYGHNCSCQRKKCKFSREMHAVDQATAEVWKL